MAADLVDVCKHHGDSSVNQLRHIDHRAPDGRTVHVALCHWRPCAGFKAKTFGSTATATPWVEGKLLVDGERVYGKRVDGKRVDVEADSDEADLLEALKRAAPGRPGSLGDEFDARHVLTEYPYEADAWHKAEAEEADNGMYDEPEAEPSHTQPPEAEDARKDPAGLPQFSVEEWDAADAAWRATMAERLASARMRLSAEGRAFHSARPELDAMVADALRSKEAEEAKPFKATRCGAGTVDVRDFGAVGDGVTDDSASVQAAVDAASATGETDYGVTVINPDAKIRVLGVDMGVGQSISVPASPIRGASHDTGIIDEQLAEVESGARQWAKLIEEKDGKSWVNARLLHAELGVGKDFSNWIKDQLVAHKCVEGQHFGVFAEIGENPKGGRPAKEYHLDPEAAKHIALATKTEVAKDMRAYLIACEEELRTGTPMPAIQRLRQGMPALSQLTHLSTLEDYKAALPTATSLSQLLSQFLQELGKRETERLLQDTTNKEVQPLLPGIESAKVAAAEEAFNKLKETAKALEKERDELKARVAELEKPMVKPASALVADAAVNGRLEKENTELRAQVENLHVTLRTRNERIAELKDELEESRPLEAKVIDLEGQLSTVWDSLQQRDADLAAMKVTADKLTELVAERDRLYDQSQKELREARLETRRVLALVEGPTKDITLTDFFKEMESVLGYSDTMGIDYLVRTGFLYREKDELGKQYLWANHDYGCYFHHVPHHYDHPITVDGGRTDKFRTVKTYTAKLIPDRKENGQIVKIGGYTWLKERMMKDVLTTLQRMIVETGGPLGEFNRFAGFILSESQEDSLPGLMSVGEKVILFAEGADGDVPKGE